MLKNIIGLSLILVVLVGCGSKNLTQEVYQNDKIYTNYNVSYPQEDENLTKYYEVLKTSIDKKFEESKIQQGDELNIKVSISNFDEGNRALRYIIGFGAGQAKAIIQTKFYDNSQNLLGELNTESKLAMGAFGGDTDQVFEIVADKIVKFAKKNFFTTR